MPTATYGEKTLPTGEILLVRVSQQQARDIPTRLFHQMLRQALNQTELCTLLREA